MARHAETHGDLVRESPARVTGDAVHENFRGRQRIVRHGWNQPVAIKDKTDAEVRAWAVALAADMEMGYYTTPAGEQWTARPFVIGQLLRHIGYAESTIADQHRPQWWPGTDAIRRMVALKVMVRRAQKEPPDTERPWVDAALAAASEELLHRLYVAPQDIASRELVDLVTKLTRLLVESHRPAAPARAVKSRTFERITETIAEFEDPAERERYARDYERVLEAARAALPERVAEPTT